MKLARRVAFATLLLLGISLVGELLAMSVYFLDQDAESFWMQPGGAEARGYSPDSEWLDDLEAASVEGRTTSLTQTEEGVTARFRFSTPTGTRFADRLARGFREREVDELVRLVFGTIEVDGKEPEGPARPTRRVDSSRVHVEIERTLAAFPQVHLFLSSPEQGPFENPADRVELREPLPITSRVGAPAATVSEDGLTVVHLSEGDPWLRIQLGAKSVADAPGDGPRARPEQKTRTALAAIDEASQWPVVARLLAGIALALPLLLAIRPVGSVRLAATADASRMVRPAGAILAFHAVVFASTSAAWDLRRWSWLRERVDAGMSLLGEGLGSPLNDYYFGEGASGAAVVVVGVLGPAIVRALLRGGHPRRRWTVWVGGFASLALLALAAAGSLAVVLEEHEPEAWLEGRAPFGAYLLPALTLALVAIGWMSVGVYRLLASSGAPFWLAPVVGVAIAGYYLLDELVSFDSRKVLFYLAYTLLSANILLAVWEAAETAFAAGASSWSASGGRARAVAAALAVPIPVLVDWEVFYIHLPVGLAFGLEQFLPFAFAAGIMWILYRTGDSSLEIQPGVRALAILGTAAILFSPSNRWLHVPVSFLLGLATLGWVVGGSDRWPRLRKLQADVLQNRRKLLGRILSLRAAERASKARRDALQEEFQKGTIDAAKYEARLDSHWNDLATLQKKWQIAKEAPREVALTFGPLETAWQNALHGARYSALLATPWILLDLFDFLSKPFPSSAYPLFPLAASLLAIVAPWILLGSLFGYFYPYLRGLNGPQKGLWLFAATVIPILVQKLLTDPGADEWRAVLFWCLQIFVHLLLLGAIAFDLAVMRQSGHRDWTLLWELHGIASIGAWASTIAVAAATAVSVALQSEISKIAGVAVRFVLPDVPELPAPR